MADNSQPSNPSQPTPQMLKLRSILTKDPSSWDEAWKQNVTPWDHGRFQPPLAEVIESSSIDFPTSGKALVPGCGTGYDCLYLAAQLGLDVIGLDVSKKAIEAAERNLEAHQNSASNKSTIVFTTADFFSLPSSSQFDLIYDYTFFVAIPPSQRPSWAEVMSSLVKSGGYLITLMYPLDQPDNGEGPPFFVKPEHYAEVLTADEWEKVFDEVPKTSLENHKGREKLAVWRRK